MQAVVLKDNRQVRVENVEDPRVESPTDCVIRITSTGTDGYTKVILKPQERPTARA